VYIREIRRGFGFLFASVVAAGSQPSAFRFSPRMTIQLPAQELDLELGSELGLELELELGLEPEPVLEQTGLM
jgi:hypothetical protein